MKLDYECVRGILLTVESLEHNQMLTNSNYAQFSLLKDYSYETICYAVARLNVAGFFPKGNVIEVINGILMRIDALTWEGHQYLDCIRDENIWKKAQKKVYGVGGAPLKILGEVAMMFIRSSVGLSN